MTLSRTTQDHDEIRKWAESRGAVPSEVASTESAGEPGILRFEFPSAPNRNDSKLKEISWDDFFEKFDENNLELVYQEKTADGERSNFNKLVHPSREEHSSRGKSHSGSHSSRSNRSSSDDNEAGRSGNSSGKSHSASSSTSHKTSASRGADMEDEDLDGSEDLADADDLDDNGGPRHSAGSTPIKSNKSGSGKSSSSTSSSKSHSSSKKK